MFQSFFKTTFHNLQRNKSYCFLNIFGLTIGIACAGLMHHWLQNYQYRIKINGWIFLAAALSANLIALFTISFQSIKTPSPTL